MARGGSFRRSRSMSAPRRGEFMKNSAKLPSRFLLPCRFVGLDDLLAVRFGSVGMAPLDHAAIDICGAAALTSASTWASKRLKFVSNIETRRFAVSAKAALSAQVFTG